MATPKVSTRIDAYAQKYQSELRKQQGKLGRNLTKYEVAEYMLKQGALSKTDFESWIKTQEGAQNRLQAQQLKNTPLFMIQNQQRGITSYLDSVSEFSIGNVMGFEKTSTGQIKKKAPVNKRIDVNKQLKEQKLRNHLKSLPKVEGDPIQMTREIEAEKEQKKLQHMSVQERKEYIMGKFLDAKNKNDKSGMFSAVEEFFSYECSVIDQKLGVTTAKNFIKDKSGLNALVDYIDKAVDDNNDKNLSKGEAAWNIIKGVGDTLDSFVGSQGLMMVGALGGATKAASLIPKAGPLVSGGIQAFFGVEGTKLVTEGTVDIADGIATDDATKVRQGASEAAMGGIMLGGAVKSAKSISSAKGAKAETTEFAKPQKYSLETDENVAALKEKGINVTYADGGDIVKDFDIRARVDFTHKGTKYTAYSKDVVVGSQADVVKMLNDAIDGKSSSLKLYKADEVTTNQYGLLEGNEIIDFKRFHVLTKAEVEQILADNNVKIEKFERGIVSGRDSEPSYIEISYNGKPYKLNGSCNITDLSEARTEIAKAFSGERDGFKFYRTVNKQLVEPSEFLKPQKADNIKGQGISFKQADGQPDYSATRIEWGETVEETIALNKANGINLEFVKDAEGNEFFGIKDVWSDGYHRVDRNSVVMHYGDYKPSETSVNADWVAKNKNPDGTIKDCAVVANDEGCKILENSYVTENGEKIDFSNMKPGTKVHKDPNAVVNAFAYKTPVKLKTLEGKIETDITMGDVDGNVYNNFKQLKKQITKNQLVPNEADPYSQRFIDLIKQGNDEAAIELLKDASAKTDRRIYF